MLEDRIRKKDILPAGKILGNRYVIEDRIGSGGMADVYSAYDRGLRLRLALKIMQEKHTSNDEFKERFKREASAAARLNHPCIARVYELGELEGYYFISMELVNGITLYELMKSYINNNQLVPVDVACKITSKVLDGLICAHREGIIHRDITPGNILVNMEDDDNPVKITDFGIAKLVIDDGSGQTANLTREGNLLGTFQYVSPEIIKGKSISEKADVFSLGAIAYEMLTGRLICGNIKDMPDTTKMFNIVHKPMKLPREFNPSIPKALQDILLKATDKDETQRYDLEEFHQALESFTKGEKVKVDGSFKRKMLLTRRELLINGTRFGAAILIIGAASYLGIKKIEYGNSIASSLDRIQESSADSLEKLRPLLLPLYRRICHRFEFMYDNTMRKQKNDMRGVSRPRIYPFGSISSGTEQGRFAFLGGDSLTAGFIIPMCYYTFEGLGQENSQSLNNAHTNRRFLNAMFEYAAGLYFAREEHGDNLSDEKELVMTRFYRAMEATTSLEAAFPLEYLARKKEVDGIRSRFAEAVKLIIEKRFNPQTRQINWLGPNIAANDSKPSAKRDGGVAAMLCDAFRLLDLETEVFYAYPQMGTTITGMDEYLTMIMDDADAKVRHLIRSKGWLAQAESKDYADLIMGMAQRARLFDEISEAGVTGIGNKGECFRKNMSQISQGQMLRVTEKNNEYRNLMNEMIPYFKSKIPESMIANYYLEKRPANPADTIATMRFLEGITIHGQKHAGSLDLDRIRLRILKSILSKEHISYANTTNVSSQRPYGFVKDTLLDISRRADYNGTYIEADYLLMKNIRMIIKE